MQQQVYAGAIVCNVQDQKILHTVMVMQTIIRYHKWVHTCTLVHTCMLAKCVHGKSEKQYHCKFYSLLCWFTSFMSISFSGFHRTSKFQSATWNCGYYLLALLDSYSQLVSPLLDLPGACSASGHSKRTKAERRAPGSIWHANFLAV